MKALTCRPVICNGKDNVRRDETRTGDGWMLIGSTYFVRALPADRYNLTRPTLSVFNR